MKKISMSPEAMTSLRAKGVAIKPKALLRLPKESLARIRQEVAILMFGPTMNPTYKARLLQFTSFQAILAGWAANHFQKVGAKKYGTSYATL